MAKNLTILERFRKVVVPTPGQAFLIPTGAILVLLASQTRSVLDALGITQMALNASGAQLQSRFATVLASPLIGNLALVIFWAVIGLITYIICWAAYNLLIELRNEMTISAQYTNHGKAAAAPMMGLIYKIASCAALVVFLLLLQPGYSLAVTLVSPIFTNPTPGNAVLTVVACLGFAVQIYAIVIGAQLTFTPWYRAQTFTDL